MRYLGFVIFYFFCQTIFAQDFSVRGVVLDDLSNPLSNSVITLYEGDVLLKFTNSKSDGRFEIKNLKSGSYNLVFSKLGFDEFQAQIQLSSDQPIIDLGSVFLSENSVELTSAVIVGKTRNNRDTIKYKVEDFSKGFELSVEDLLKEIPGFSVDKEGRIKVDGNSISKVLVEGDDMFSDGYSILTQNMPAKPLENIQMIKNYSKNKVLRGIQESDETVLNLKLKEKEMGKWMSSLELATTSYIEDMHQLKLNLMNFKSNFKLFTLVNFNNLGIEEMAGVKYLFRSPTTKSIEKVEDLLGNEYTMLENNLASTFMDQRRDNFNKDLLSAFNLIKTYKNQWKVHLLGVFNRTERNRFTNEYYHYDFENEEFTNIKNTEEKSTQLNSIGQLSISKESEKTSFHFQNQVFYKDALEQKEILFNQLPNSMNEDEYFFKQDHQLNYAVKLDSVSALNFVGKFVNQKNQSHLFENSNVLDEVLGDDLDDQVHQYIKENMQFAGAKAAYVKNIKKSHYLELQLGGEWKQNQNQSQLWASELNQFQELTDFQNDFDFQLWNLYLKSTLNYKLTKRWKLNLSLDQNYLSSDFNGILKSNKTSAYNFQPQIGFSYSKLKFGDLSFGYSKSMNLLGSEYLYQNYIYLGNRFFTNNRLDFTPLNSHHFNFKFERKVLPNSLKLWVEYRLNDEYLAGSTHIVPNHSQITRILLKDNSNFSSELELGRFVDVLKSKIFLIPSFQTHDYQNQINDEDFRENRQNQYALEVKFTTGWLSKLNFSTKFRSEWNVLKSDSYQNKYNNLNYQLKLSYYWNENLRFESNFEVIEFGNTNQNTIEFFDVKFDYKLKDSQTHFYLLFNNLFNEKYIENFAVNNVSETLYRQRIIPLHVVAGCRINLF